MTAPKRPYETPVVKAEEFKLGVYGSYENLETTPSLPVTTYDPNGRTLHLD